MVMPDPSMLALSLRPASSVQSSLVVPAPRLRPQLPCLRARSPRPSLLVPKQLLPKALPCPPQLSAPRIWSHNPVPSVGSEGGAQLCPAPQ